MGQKNKRFKKILLINPTNTMPVDSVRRIGEPLGLLYLGASLINAGYEVIVFDMTLEGYDNCEINNGYVTYGSGPNDLKNKLMETNPDIVGVSCMFTAREQNTISVCSIVKEVNRELPVVLGGLHPSTFPDRFFKTDLIDYIIFEEGEFRLVKLLDCLNNEKKPDFDGVAYRENRKFKINPALTKIEDLDSIPYPDRDLVEMEEYIKIGVPYAPFSYKQRVAQILATRGCPNNCNFCSTVKYWGRKIRARSVGNIIGEMKILKDKYNIEEIQFVDDNLTVNKAFSMELFSRMKDFNFKWCTPHGLMFNSLDGEMIKAMADCGAYQLTFAIESGSKRVLRDIIHKNVNLDKVKEIVAEAHKYDISVHGMFVMGFPGERKEEIMQTLNFPFEVGFDSVSYFVVNPLPGTDLYFQCKEKNYLTENYSSMDFKSANIVIPKTSADYYGFEPNELVELIDKKTHEFNEWAKKEYPERWQRKFDRYLKNHPENKKTIMGRVT